MNPERFRATCRALGIGFAADTASIALYMLEAGQPLSSQGKIALERLHVVLKSLFVIDEYELILTDQDYIKMANDRWYKKSHLQVGKLAVRNKLSTQNLIEDCCSTVEKVISDGYSSVPEDKITLVRSVLEIISTLTLDFVGGLKVL